jgi:hypothetical protein
LEERGEGLIEPHSLGEGVDLHRHPLGLGYKRVAPPEVEKIERQAEKSGEFGVGGHAVGKAGRPLLFLCLSPSLLSESESVLFPCHVDVTETLQKKTCCETYREPSKSGLRNKHIVKHIGVRSQPEI